VILWLQLPGLSRLPVAKLALKNAVYLHFLKPPKHFYFNPLSVIGNGNRQPKPVSGVAKLAQPAR